MGFINSKSLRLVALSIAVVFVAAIAVVSLGAQQGPPQGRGRGMGPGQGMGPGGMGGPGSGRGFGMMRGPMGPGGRGPMGQMLMHGLGQLNLTDAQKEQIKAAMESHKDEFKAIADRMIASREALGDTVTAGGFDEAAIRAKAAEVAAVEADAAVLRAKVHAQVFALLTPEQQARANQLRAEAKDRIKQGPGGMFGRGGRGPGRGGPGRWL